MPIVRFALASLALAAAACAAQQGPAPVAAGACTWPEGHVLLIAGGFEPLEVKPGEPMPLGLHSSPARFSPPEPLPASCRVAWSVEPAGAASVDAAGRLSVPTGTAPGTEFVVVAEVAGERVRRAVHVADPEPGPLAGTWRQAGRPNCVGAPPAGDTVGIGELELRPTGRFSVTWSPFETYRDYWGRYRYDRATGALSWRSREATSVPPGLDLDGLASVEEGRLVLRDFWFGSRSGVTGSPSCTFTFARVR